MLDYFNNNNNKVEPPQYLKRCVQSKVIYRDNIYRKWVTMFMITKTTTGQRFACRHRTTLMPDKVAKLMDIHQHLVIMTIKHSSKYSGSLHRKIES